MLQFSTFSEQTRRGIEIASQAFATPFREVPISSCKSTLIPAPNTTTAAVKVAVTQQNDHVEIELMMTDSPEEVFVGRGQVQSESFHLLQQLGETVQKLIEKDIELNQQDDLLTDYASQISRDFEELVWTRQLAHHIQQTDIRDSLGAFVDQIFPTLMETVQASQLVLLQLINSPAENSNPEIQNSIDIRSLGSAQLSEDDIRLILDKYSERAKSQPVVCNHCSSLGIQNLSCFILVPIQVQQREFGWILAVNRESDFSIPVQPQPSLLPLEEFGSFEAGLMQATASFLASHANNTSLYAEKEDLLIGIVRAMINAIDAKDHYTCGHSDRVAAISRRLAIELKLTERECEEIYLAGLLHDVGKIGVPDRILLKKESLTDAEMEILKQHPVIGYRVLKHLKQIAYILPGVLHHHESLDGTGYPEGLIGDQIPLQARIIAVADAFDAMTSDRPYRKGMPYAKAEEILKQNRGPQWDPTIVDCFISSRLEIQNLCSKAMRPNHIETAMNEGAEISHAVELAN